MLSSLAIKSTAEVERILRSFKPNPYDVLDVPAFAAVVEIEKSYRKKSLLIHPDKFKHEHGEDAFNFLSHARDLLCDEKRREEIDSITTYARVVVLREAGLPRTLDNRDPRLTGMCPPFEARLRAQVKRLVLESSADQKKRADMVATNQATQRLATEALISARKRKAEEQIAWEQGREARVGSWRNHLDRTKQRKIKKAKKNQYVLG